MRHVRRRRRPRPMDHPAILEVQEQLDAHHMSGGTRRTQRDLNFDALFWQIREALSFDLPKLFSPSFGHFCAYTEVVLEDPEIALHRPARDSIGLDEDVSPDHYFWLATVWDNWYPADPDVVRIKGNFFPVWGERSRLPDFTSTSIETRGVQEGSFSTLSEIGRASDPRYPRPRLDRGLLLDPCRDFPQWWMRAMEDGTYEPVEHPASGVRRAYGHVPRAALTIDTLALNDDHLVAQRRAFTGSIDPLETAGLGDAPFSGFRRQLAARHLLSLSPGEAREHAAENRAIVRDLAPELAALAVGNPDAYGAPPSSGLAGLPGDVLHAMVASVRRTRGGSPTVDWLRDLIERTRQQPPQIRPRVASAQGKRELERPESPTHDVIRRDAFVTGIEIENFRCIESVRIDLSTGRTSVEGSTSHGRDTERPPGQVPSLALLGENGHGKSSVLQAVALGLASGQADDPLEGAPWSWADLLRRDADHGRVRITFGDGQQIALAFDEGSSWRESQPTRMEMLVRAYGTARSLTSNQRSSEGREVVRIQNLFDPRHTLLDPESWMLGLETESFNIASAALRTFLDMEEDHIFAVVGNTVEVNGTPFRHLSDGYRALIALLCDIMAASGLEGASTQSTRGVVLIDEIGENLHPRWRMHVTRRLRAVFPRVQFLLSTHEPLCLRGLHAGEVVRVRRTGLTAPAVLEQIARSPSAFRVDQLLTSEFFGLGTAIDPEEEEKLAAYYRARQELRDAQAGSGTQEEEAIARLEARVTELRPAPMHGVLGATRRDQLVFEVIDDYLTREPELNNAERPEERRAAIEAAADIWRPRWATNPEADVS